MHVRPEMEPLHECTPTKEDGLSVEQDLGAFGFQIAKTDLILHAIGFGFDHYLIKLWIAGAQSVRLASNSIRAAHSHR
jgi:hypothetical protein